MRPLPAFLLLAALLAAPLGDAHRPSERPTLQDVEPLRLIDMKSEGDGVVVTLSLTSDPLRQWVQHTVGPKGGFTVEHRLDASNGADAFAARWRLVRIVEYRDLNLDGIWTPELDTPIRSWRMSNARWEGGQIVDAATAGVLLKDVSWTANVSGGPSLRLEAGAAGREFNDEGARVRPQDVILYFDASDFPPRGTGSLHALEWEIVTHAGTPVAPLGTNGTSGIMVDGGWRRAYFEWGAEALADGQDGPIHTYLSEPTPGEGTELRQLRMSLPLLDRTLRLVMVSAVEYETRKDRLLPEEGWLAPLALLAAGLSAAARRR